MSKIGTTLIEMDDGGLNKEVEVVVDKEIGENVKEAAEGVETGESNQSEEETEDEEAGEISQSHASGDEGGGVVREDRVLTHTRWPRWFPSSACKNASTWSSRG